jgi:glutaconyl-CoA decarboxylase
MPTYEIFIDGKPQRIELARNGEKSFTVKVEGKSAKVELQTDKLNLDKPFSLSIEGRNYQVELPKIDREKPFQIKVDGAAFNAELKTPIAKVTLASLAPTPSAPAKRAVTRNQVVEGAITAPMTGKIVSVKVKKGDSVKANQVLCVIEAMKMENEIGAPRAGAVQEVNVSEGSSVSEGDVLFVVG